MPPPPADHAPLRRQRAADPATAPALLAHLLTDANLHVRRAAAANPNVPADTLRLLHRAGATPDLAGTRAVPPESLDPNALGQLVALGDYAQDLAARHPDATAAALHALATSDRAALRRRVAQHPRAAATTLRRLITDPDTDTRRYAADHPGLPADALSALTRAGATADLSAFTAPDPDHHADFDALAHPGRGAHPAAGPYARQLAARHPACPPPLLETLATDPHRAVRAAVAENPHAPAGLLARLAEIDDADLRLRLAQHPHLGPDTLDELARDPDASLRALVAQHPAARPDLLARLALDGAHAVREHVAAHPRFADPARQAIVAAGSTPDLQGFQAPDPDLPPDTLARLASTGHWGKQLAARHPQTGPDTLAQLATHPDPTLRETATGHPRFADETRGLLVRAGSASDAQGYEPPQPLHPNDPDALLALGPWAHRLLARHPDATPEHLTRLARSADHTVRREAGRHSRTPIEALAALAQDQAHDVRWTLARRADLTPSLLETLAADPLPAIRLAALHHPHTTPAVAQRLRFDLDEDVRNAAKSY